MIRARIVPLDRRQLLSQQKNPGVSTGVPYLEQRRVDLEIHAAHAAAAHAAWHLWWGVLWLFGDHGFGGDQQ
jgi:hypothetical protein